MAAALVRLCIYVPGTFYCNPFKPFLNAVAGSSYGLAYGHFRRDHSDPLNVLHGAASSSRSSATSRSSTAWTGRSARTASRRSRRPRGRSLWGARRLHSSCEGLHHRPAGGREPGVRGRGAGRLLCVAHAPHGPARADLLLALPAGPRSQAARAPWFCAALAARTACCVVLRDRAGLLGGAPMLGAFIVVAIKLSVASCAR